MEAISGEDFLRWAKSRPDFRPTAWEHPAQGKPFRRRPGYTDRSSWQSEGLRARCDGSQVDNMTGTRIERSASHGVSHES